jgi:hypothetical protein
LHLEHPPGPHGAAGLEEIADEIRRGMKAGPGSCGSSGADVLKIDLRIRRPGGATGRLDFG